MQVTSGENSPFVHFAASVILDSLRSSDAAQHRLHHHLEPSYAHRPKADILRIATILQLQSNFRTFAACARNPDRSAW